MSEHGAVPVVGLDLTDLDLTGEPESLAGVLLDLCCSAARLVQEPASALGAKYALEALASTVEEGLPEFGRFVRGALQLLDEMASALNAPEKVVTR